MSKVLIGLVGDVLIDREQPAEIFSAVRDVLHSPDILFGNLESAYTDTPRPVPSAMNVLSAPAHNLNAYAPAGFDVMSLANNHILDAGYEAMLETRARLRDQGVKTCGAGDCLSDARAPASIEHNGLRVAFLAYSSVFPMGYEARSDRPGLAPMRAYNLWRAPFPTLHEPGVQPHITTVPDATDLALLARDIRQARESADLVITSFHWGDYTCPFRLTDHELRTARYCIDEGADLVVGHHHHALRGMEWYKGKPIMYGLGHFVFDIRVKWSDVAAKVSEWAADGYIEQMQYKPGPREGWPLLPMHEDTRMTLLAWANAGKGGVTDIGFLPCALQPDGRVHPLRLNSAECNQVVEYMKKCNSTQRLNGSIVADSTVELAGFPTLRVVARGS